MNWCHNLSLRSIQLFIPLRALHHSILVHAREARLPANVMFGTYDQSLNDPEQMLEYAAQLQKRYKAASQLVRKSTIKRSTN